VLINVLRDVAGVTAGQAAAYDVIVHAALFLPVVVLGTLVLWRSHMTFGQVTQVSSATPEAGALPGHIANAQQTASSTTP
jgi:hypothetical protein